MFDAVPRFEVGGGQEVDGFRVPGRSMGPLGHRQLVGHEEVVEVSGDETGRGFLFADYAHGVFAVQVPRLAQQRLLAVVMVIVVVPRIARRCTRMASRYCCAS